MEACSVDLCSLVSRVLTELLGALSRSLLNKFRKDEHVQPPLMETETVTVTGKFQELPQDVLMDIFDLLEIPDLVRVGSVCSSWRSAYTSLRSLGQFKRPQTPCLLYTSESAGENVACLYSLAEKRVYKLTLPDPPIRTRHLIGSSHGWLVTADERSELHLVNPITGEQIALPSVITIEQVKPIFDNGGAIRKYQCPRYFGERKPSIHTRENLRHRLYFKAFVFSDPSTRNYIVALIHNPQCVLSFARAGDCKWTRLPSLSSTPYAECIYMDGLLYALTITGGIDAFDLTGPTVTRKIVMNPMKDDYIGEQMYIVQAPWGDVLQVWRETGVAAGNNEEDAPWYWDLSKVVYNTRKILLYKVDMAAKEIVEINGLHDHVLFLGHNQSQCLSAEEYPQLKANRVYFTDDHKGIPEYRKSRRRRDIGVFNLENNNCEEIVSPQLWCNWPNPIWITPNLTLMNSGLNK